MGLRSKSKRKEERNKKRRELKEARKRLYQSYAAAGKQKGSKRFKKGTQKKSAKAVDHPDGPCGNIGCLKCFGVVLKPYLNGAPRPPQVHQLILRLTPEQLEEARKGKRIKFDKLEPKP